MFFIYYKLGNYSYKPSSEMCIFFNNQKNYSTKEENSNPLQEFLINVLINKKIDFCAIPPFPIPQKKMMKKRKKKIK